jgi:hypothetical protein
MARKPAVESRSVRLLLEGILELLGPATLSGPDATRRLNDMRPVVGTLVDLDERSGLSDADLLWAGRELADRARQQREGGGP